MDQVRKLVALAGPTPRAGQIVAGRSGSGWAEGRKQARGGQPLPDPERLIVGEFRRDPTGLYTRLRPLA